MSFKKIHADDRCCLGLWSSWPEAKSNKCQRCALSGGVRMSEAKTPAGQIRSEVHGRVFKIIIDNAAKKNAFSPEMMAQMSDALTTLHNNDEYWVGVVYAEGSDFTAGLD